jgi:hypothetical protein
MPERRSHGFFHIRPFENDDPFSRDPSRLFERQDKIVGFVEHVPEKHDIEALVGEGDVFGRAGFKINKSMAVISRRYQPLTC